MGRWTVKTNPVKGTVSLTYEGRDKEVQDCGTCEVGLKSQLLDWMFSAGQVDAFDVVDMDGHEFYAMNRRGRA